MADVYKAKDHKLNRFVAVKVLKAEYRGDEAFVSKFRVEAQAAAGLSHPNIVNVYDVGDENGVYFIVMELVEGITLKAYIQNRGQLSVREATGITLQVAAGLESAHNNGIIHRDVKPQNIIISMDGTAKVADFGIARAASSDTINSNVMGSVHYSAPEQSRGGYSDAKSDIYSLGITMYEMLTGKVPFDGDSTVEVALKHLQEEIVPPREVLPDLPCAVEEIILKCTQKSPDRRYANMSELIRDLKESLVNPNGHFVRMGSEREKGATQLYSPEEVEEIRRRHLSGNVTAAPAGRNPDEDEEEDDDLLEDPDEERYDGDGMSPKGARGRGGKSARSRGGSGSRDGRSRSRRRSEILVGLICVLAALAVVGALAYVGVHSYRRLTGTGHESDAGSDDSLVQVPDLVGKTEAEAQTLLRASGLTGQYGGDDSLSAYESGLVTTQSPAAGSSAAAGSTVVYTVSTGAAQTLTVPDLTDTELGDARKALESMNLQVVIDTSRYSQSIIEGRVIQTNPGAGSTVHAGDTVIIYVSQGIDSGRTEVPEVTGYYEADAIAALKTSKLYAFVKESPSSEEEKGLVIDQDIAAGTMVEENSAVTITVGAGPEEVIVIGTESAAGVGSSGDSGTGAAATGDSSEDDGDGSSGSAADGEDSTESDVWSASVEISAPGGYDGQPVRITLIQEGEETRLFEGYMEFPVTLRVEGKSGVSTGDLVLSILDPDTGEVVSRVRYQGLVFSAGS